MGISSFFGAVSSYSLETPKVQLTLKGLVLGLLEMKRQDRRNELFHFVHLECLAMGKPRYDVALAILFALTKHIV